MMTSKNKGPRSWQGPAARRSYDTPQPIRQALNPQTPVGDTLARRWFDIAEWFIGAVWAAWEPDQVVDPSLDFVLAPDDFPTSEHWSVVQALAAFAECGERPTIGGVRGLLRANGWSVGDGDEWDFVKKTAYLECTPAGLSNFAAVLQDCGRRRRLAGQLRALYARIADPFDPLPDVTAALRDILEAGSWN